MVSHIYFILIVIIPVVIYGCRTPINHGIKAQQQENDFIKISKAHPDFLDLFPTLAEI